jgi:hypothetical protein
VLSCVLSGHRRNWPAAAGKPGSQKNYAAGLEIRCPGGVYFNRDNSQLAPILVGVMPSECELVHSRLISFQRGSGLGRPSSFTNGVVVACPCGAETCEAPHDQPVLAPRAREVVTPYRGAVP